MSTNQVQAGLRLEITAPYALSGGDGCLVGDAVFGVAHMDALISTQVIIDTVGVFALKKQSSLTITAGDTVYWDDGAKECDTTDTNDAIGVCTETAASGDANVNVKLRGYASNDLAVALAAGVVNAAGVATNVSGIATNVTDIGTNAAAIASVDSDIVDVDIVFADVGGGGTTGPGTVQVNDRAGAAISRAVILRLALSDTQYAGPGDAATTATMGSATTGSILAGSGSNSLVILTSASGAFAATITDSADEVVWISCRSTDGGVASAGQGCLVRDCIEDSIEFTA